MSRSSRKTHVIRDDESVCNTIQDCLECDKPKAPVQRTSAEGIH